MRKSGVARVTTFCANRRMVLSATSGSKRASTALTVGALGIVVDVTIRCVPEFMLHAVEKGEPLEDVLDNWLERVAAVDHFEFYWFPHTTSALTKTNTHLPAETKRKPG